MVLLKLCQAAAGPAQQPERTLRRRGLALLAPLAPLALLAPLACGDGLEPVPFQGVSGTVTFQGAVPDSTEWVRLAVYREVPQTITGLFQVAAFSDTLPLGRDSIAYVLALEPGVYRWLPAVWKRAGVPLAVGLRVMGWYSPESPFGPPSAFTVELDAETADIDLTADFDNLLGVDEVFELLP